MTPQHAKLLAFIDEFTTLHGHAPSFVEMAEHLGLRSTGNVHRMVQSLVRQGRIVYGRNRARSIEVVKPSAESPIEAIVHALIERYGSGSLIITTPNEVRAVLKEKLT